MLRIHAHPYLYTHHLNNYTYTTTETPRLSFRECNETIGCEYHLGVATMAYIISLLANCIVWERDPPLSLTGFFPRPHTLLRP